jgi:hypothetical protein
MRNFITSPNVIGVIKRRNVRWAGYAESMRGIRNAYEVFVGKLKWQTPLGKRKHS